MLINKSPHKTRNLVKRQKLSQLLDCFQANSQSSYKITVNRGALKTVVDDNRNFFGEFIKESQQAVEYNNCEQMQRQCKKKMGLFANIIRNMDAKRQVQESYKKLQARQKPRGYTFYFTELDHKNKQVEGQRSRPETAQTQQNHFDHINLTNKITPNYYNESNKQNEQSAQKGQAFVDLNFSFDEINKHMQSVKQASIAPEQRRVEEDTIIRKYLNDNSEAFGENSKNDVKLSKGSQALQKQSVQKSLKNEKASPPLINFAKFSKQYKVKQSQFLPLPLKTTNSIGSNQKQAQYSALQGTKKVQSRIVSTNTIDPHAIKIDFDLDINFI